MQDEAQEPPRRSARSVCCAGVDALADSEGIDALSMRKLGQELNAGAMSLRHFIDLL